MKEQTVMSVPLLDFSHVRCHIPSAPKQLSHAVVIRVAAAAVAGGFVLDYKLQ